MLSNQPLLNLFGMGASEMILIVIALLLLFGGKKIPELMRGIGKGVKEFKDAQAGKSTEEASSSMEKKA